MPFMNDDALDFYILILTFADISTAWFWAQNTPHALQVMPLLYWDVKTLFSVILDFDSQGFSSQVTLWAILIEPLWIWKWDWFLMLTSPYWLIAPRRALLTEQPLFTSRRSLFCTLTITAITATDISGMIRLFCRDRTLLWLLYTDARNTDEFARIQPFTRISIALFAASHWVSGAFAYFTTASETFLFFDG
jgi:hypothetical protein